MSSKQIGEPTEEINILLRRTAVPKCDITPAVKGLISRFVYRKQQVDKPALSTLDTFFLKRQ